MVASLTAGAVLGLSAGIVPGPLLALVISQTLKYSVKEGMKVAAAPLITDVPIIGVSLFVVSELSRMEPLLGIVSLLGGLYVLYMAYEGFSARPGDAGSGQGAAHSFTKGALINALNPHPYLFWITVGAPFVVQGGAAGSGVAFVMSFYGLLVGSKVTLAWVVGKSRGFLTSRAYVVAMRLLAVLLVFFALMLFANALSLLR
ncbi:MAG: LysE family translocator [Deltaproteobacteria bacterium]|nr:LysE family translocator [Deltaproteobacteria bacterium]